MSKVKIRMAGKEDASRLLEIYRPYIEKTAVSFEYTVPSVEKFEERIVQVTKRYPWLAAEQNGEILGYAYASRFHERAAYDWAVETSVYVDADARKIGLGKTLYKMLERVLAEQNILNLNACIAYTEKEDEYLTNDSIRFHQCLGYREVGRFHQCGYKFGRWYDMIWMEKMIGEHTGNPLPVLGLERIRPQIQGKYGIV